jgi:atypical dual specificity phosphatase
MSLPDGFTWVDPPLLAAMARPASLDDYLWLREQNVHLVISLCENPPPRRWLNDAGLFSMHIPIEDMTAPTSEQVDQCLAAVERAQNAGFAACIHCAAGLGRTGTMLACYFVKKGMKASAATSHVRQIRPGSIETSEQAEAVLEFSRRVRKEGE